MKSQKKRRPRKPKNNVVSFFGASVVHHPGNPDPEVISDAKWLLERAEAGEVVGFALVVNYFDTSTADRYSGRVGTTVLGGLSLVAQRIANAINNA